MITTKEATDGLFAHAHKLPFNIAPELADCLFRDVFGSEIWDLNSSSIPSAYFSAVVQDKTIYMSPAGLASVWCLTRAAYCMLDAASRAAQSDKYKETTVDFGEVWANQRLGDYIKYARLLIHNDDTWPPHLVLPNANATMDTEDGRINNLFYGAIAWIQLHEIAHIYHKDSIYCPAFIKQASEYKADAFATQWVLRSANGYQREFRALSICVALAWLLLYEDEKGPSIDHPRSILRFRDVVSVFELDEDSPALENGYYFLKAIFDPRTSGPENLNARDSFEWICGRLEAIFSPKRLEGQISIST